jgi:hypothetical protein
MMEYIYIYIYHAEHRLVINKRRNLSEDHPSHPFLIVACNKVEGIYGDCNNVMLIAISTGPMANAKPTAQAQFATITKAQMQWE